AVHEAGHALIAKILNVGVVEKVSILKRGHALGVTWVTREQDATLQSEPEVRSRMTMLLAGRGAEALVLKSASTGAANDLEHVSRMAFRMVTEFGFSSDIGPFSYAGLLEHRGALELLTAELLEHETVTGDVVEQCLAAERMPRAFAA